MTLRDSQQGAGHIVAVLAIVILAVVGFVGYRTYQAGQDSSAPTPATNQEPQPATVPDDINNKDDLTQADKAVEAAPVKSDLDTKKLDQDVGELF